MKNQKTQSKILSQVKLIGFCHLFRQCPNLSSGSVSNLSLLSKNTVVLSTIIFFNGIQHFSYKHFTVLLVVLTGGSQEFIYHFSVSFSSYKPAQVNANCGFPRM